MKYDLSLITSSRFCYQDVMKSFDLDYEETASVLSDWEEAGLIRPIRSSGRVAFTPSFYARYQKIRMVKDQTAERERILHLHPSLISFYLSHLSDYEKMEPEILKLSSYLSSHKQELSDPDCLMTVKERSYAIFGNEKYLEQHHSAIPLSDQELNCRPTYEPFFARETDPEGNEILVLENRDPWDSISSQLKPGMTFLGHRFSMVIYGEGNKVAVKDQSGSLYGFLSSCRRADQTVLYCGDIDRAGINIFSRLCEADPELQILPFQELYLEMIHLAPEDLSEAEDTEDHRDRTYDSSFLDFFAGTDRERIHQVLEKNKRVPQEIVNRSEVRRLLG